MTCFANNKTQRMMRCQSLWWLECIYFPWITYRDETNRLFHPPLPSHSCADTPVFLAKPSIAFFTDYEIGPVYEVRIWFLYISHSASLFLKSLCCGNLKTCTHTHTHAIHRTREKTVTFPYEPITQLQLPTCIQQVWFHLLSPQFHVCGSVCTCVHWNI